jgi:ADP-heptose:LPS heptosyltransferase
MAEELILVIQLRQLGDILLTTPVLRAIKRERPKARVTFLSHGMGRLVLDHCPYMDEHFFYDDTWTWRQELRLARTLRSRRYDLVLDFMNNPRSAFYALGSGARERVAFRSARRPAYTRVVPRITEPAYIVREKMLLLQAAGFQAETPSDGGLVLPWFEPQTQPLLRLLGEQSVFREAPVRVVLSPTHRREARRWPLERYAEVADRLARRWGAAVLWIWGPGEEEVVDRAIALCKEPAAALKAPRTSFRELAALIGNADLFVGNSNGPSHVAVAGGICSLQLHGPTRAVSWCPLTEQHQALQAADGAMDSITADAVWEKLEGMRDGVAAFARDARPKRPRLSWRH